MGVFLFRPCIQLQKMGKETLSNFLVELELGVVFGVRGVRFRAQTSKPLNSRSGFTSMVSLNIDHSML